MNKAWLNRPKQHNPSPQLIFGLPGIAVSQSPLESLAASLVGPEPPEPWPDLRLSSGSRTWRFRKGCEIEFSSWMHPRSMAYFPASSMFEAILGELYSAAFNNPAFDWVCSPAITELEIGMASWVTGLLNLPGGCHASSNAHDSSVIMGSTTGCLITTTCSARDRMLETQRDPLDDGEEKDNIRERLVVLSSSETHISTAKAANVIGVKHRSIACDPSSGIAMTGSHVQAAINECLSGGLIPFYVTATFGTTSSCAVDDLESIADVKRSNPSLWVHVDAAYAGAALACDEWKSSALTLEDLDSFSVNMGKWLLTNIDCT